MRTSAALALLLALVPVTAAADFADHWANPDDAGRKKSPRRGFSRVAVIPVVVADIDDDLELDAVHELFEGDGPSSFSSYFANQSLGTLTVEAVVLPHVELPTCPLDLEKYPNCRIRRGDLSAASDGIAVIARALQRADLAGWDAREFDRNGANGVPDGIVDGVILLTNMPYGGIALPVFDLNRGTNLAGGEGGSFFVDGIEIPIVAIAGDRWTAIHEFGHVLGLTDLYNEDDSAHGLQWSLMGDWFYDPEVPQLDAPSRVALGWANVHTVRGEERLTLPPAEDFGDVVKLGAGPEHFLVENRGPGRVWDRAMTARGLAVYHVDQTEGPVGIDGGYAIRLLQCVECDPWRPYLMNVQADGLFELQRKEKRHDDENDLFRDGDVLLPDPVGIPLGPESAVLSSNRYDGTPTGIELRDVVVDAATGAITFTAVGPEVDPCEAVRCPRGEVCADGGCALPATPGPGPDDGGAAPADGGGGAEESSGCAASAGGASLFGLLAALALLRRR